MPLDALLHVLERVGFPAQAIAIMIAADLPPNISLLSDCSNVWLWPLWKDCHNGHYEKSPFMRSWGLARVQITSRAGRPTRSSTFHNYCFVRNSSSESEVRKRSVPVSGSRSFSSTFSFIARLTSAS